MTMKKAGATGLIRDDNALLQRTHEESAVSNVLLLVTLMKDSHMTSSASDQYSPSIMKRVERFWFKRPWFAGNGSSIPMKKV